VYADPRVVEFISKNFVPVRVHVREQAAEYKRLGERYAAQWTPTILVLDAEGEERHRIEGFLPAEDFLAQLQLALAQSAFKRGVFDEAERHFRAVVERYPNTEAAPEALYWAGVSRYKGTGEAAALADTAAQFRGRYQETSWAKKG
jgi:TolA-binding protein